MNRRIVIFAGPSLPKGLRPAGPFDWRPPAAAGDLVALLEDPPDKAILIDGFFDSCPAPWHKELLLLMSRGTKLFGASSMGALRAAELDRFGMVGAGLIYRAYRDGRLTGDDEVALIHGPAAIDWAPLTVPMVEFRATLVAACRSGLIPVDACRDLLPIVRDIHFSERDWPMIEKVCIGEGWLPDLIGWLRSNHVPLKKLDAQACMHAALNWSGPAAPCPEPPITCFIRQLLSEKLPDRGQQLLRRS